MEKFSGFNDPLTGINPFIAPRCKPISTKTLVIAAMRFPIYILYCLGFPVLRFLIEIKKKSTSQPKGLIYCNSVTEFDKNIVKEVFGISLFGYFKHKTCVMFPENASTNNRAILRHQRSEECEHVIGLKYSENCIYMYGSRLQWLVGFLGEKGYVTISTLKGNNLSEAVSVPLVMLDFEDKKRFMSMIK